MPMLVTYSNYFVLYLVFWLTLFNVLMLGTLLTVLFSTSTFGKIVIFAVINATSLFKLVLNDNWS